MRKIVIVCLVVLLSACDSSNSCENALFASEEAVHEAHNTAKRALKVGEQAYNIALKWKEAYCGTTEGKQDPDCE